MVQQADLHAANINRPRTLLDQRTDSGNRLQFAVVEEAATLCVDCPWPWTHGSANGVPTPTLDLTNGGQQARRRRVQLLGKANRLIAYTFGRGRAECGQLCSHGSRTDRQCQSNAEAQN